MFRGLRVTAARSAAVTLRAAPAWVVTPGRWVLAQAGARLAAHVGSYVVSVPALLRRLLEQLREPNAGAARLATPVALEVYIELPAVEELVALGADPVVGARVAALIQELFARRFEALVDGRGIRVFALEDLD